MSWISAPVTWDATAASPKALATAGSAGTTITWSHTFGPIVGLLTVVVDGHGAGGFDVAGDFTHVLTVGGIALTPLAQSDLHAAGADGWVEVWALSDPAVAAFASTTQTIIARVYHTTDPTNYPALFGASVSYAPEHIEIGAVASENTGIGNTTAPAVASATGHRVFSAIGSSAISAPSGTVRFLDHYAGIIIGGRLGDEWLLVQDQAGAASVTPSCHGFGWQTAIDFDLAGFTYPPGWVTPAGAVIATTMGGPGGIPVGHGGLALPANWRPGDQFTTQDEVNVAAMLNVLIASIGAYGVTLPTVPTSWVAGVWAANDENAVRTAINSLNAAVSQLGGPTLTDVPPTGPAWLADNENTVETAINKLIAAVTALSAGG